MSGECRKKQQTVALHTLGCRLNFSETGSLSQEFVDRGYKVVPFGESADVVVLNTCTVTDGADSTCRNLIRKAHRSSPEGKIVVVGCYAQMEAHKVKSMQGVDLVLGTQEKFNIFKYLDEDLAEGIKIDQTNEFWGAATTMADHHTRAFLKIQDGCNYICSYCIIPQARGRSRAVSVEAAVVKACELVNQGFKELILTGVNIGEYEHITGQRLSSLVAEILNISGLKRLRLSSVEPNTITNDLLDVLKSSDKFMHHFHIPLQSGDDNVLKSMRRKYTVFDYKNIIEKIKSAFPAAGIGADIILGHPGETVAQFEKTYDLLQKLPITHFHPFPFSSRKGTMSATFNNQIQHEVKKERVLKVMRLGEEKLQKFAAEQLGATQNVLFEQKNSLGHWEGYTPHFVKVCVPPINGDGPEVEGNLRNQILPVFLEGAKGGKINGSLGAFLH